ncbi:hypothetical protein V1478_012461 [Vespula squamosa]|uniref:Uncharacterized protein n=1 Tax=Vespula squamosa TaxID=30214 RepID=A0ABD2AFH4_VESSQ
MSSSNKIIGHYVQGNYCSKEKQQMSFTVSEKRQLFHSLRIRTIKVLEELLRNNENFREADPLVGVILHSERFHAESRGNSITTMPSAELIVSVVGWNQLHSVSRRQLSANYQRIEVCVYWELRSHSSVVVDTIVALKTLATRSIFGHGFILTKRIHIKMARSYGLKPCPRATARVQGRKVLARTFTRRQEKEEKRRLRRTDKEMEESIDGDNEERLGVCENPVSSNLVAQPTHKFLEYMASGLRAITNRLPSPARAHIAEPFPIPLTRAIVYKSRPPIR